MLAGSVFKLMESENIERTQKIIHQGYGNVADNILNCNYAIISGQVRSDLKEFVELRATFNELSWKGVDWINFVKKELNGTLENSNFSWRFDKKALLFEGISFFVAQENAFRETSVLLNDNGGHVQLWFRGEQAIVLSDANTIPSDIATQIIKTKSILINRQWVNDCLENDHLLAITENYMIPLNISFGFDKLRINSSLIFSIKHRDEELCKLLKRKLSAHGAVEAKRRETDALIVTDEFLYTDVDPRMRTSHCISFYLECKGSKSHDCTQYWHIPIRIATTANLEGKTFQLDILDERGSAFISNIILQLQGSLHSGGALITDRDRTGIGQHPSEFLKRLQLDTGSTTTVSKEESTQLVPAMEYCAPIALDSLCKELPRLPSHKQNFSYLNSEKSYTPQYLKNFTLFMRQKLFLRGFQEMTLAEIPKPLYTIVSISYNQVTLETGTPQMILHTEGNCLLEGLVLAANFTQAKRFVLDTTEFVTSQIYCAIGVTGAIPVWKDEQNLLLLLYTPCKRIELFSCRIDKRPFLTNDRVGVHFWIDKDVGDVILKNGVVHSVFAHPQVARIQQKKTFMREPGDVNVWEIYDWNTEWAQKRGVPLRVSIVGNKLCIDRCVDESRHYVDIGDAGILRKHLKFSDDCVSVHGIIPNIVCNDCAPVVSIFLLANDNSVVTCSRCGANIPRGVKRYISANIAMHMGRKGSLRSSLSTKPPEESKRHIFVAAVSRFKLCSVSFSVTPQMIKQLKNAVSACPFETLCKGETLEYDEDLDQFFLAVNGERRMNICTRFPCFTAYRERKRFCFAHTDIS